MEGQIYISETNLSKKEIAKLVSLYLENRAKLSVEERDLLLYAIKAATKQQGYTMPAPVG